MHKANFVPLLSQKTIRKRKKHKKKKKSDSAAVKALELLMSVLNFVEGSYYRTDIFYGTQISLIWN